MRPGQPTSQKDPARVAADDYQKGFEPEKSNYGRIGNGEQGDQPKDSQNKSETSERSMPPGPQRPGSDRR